MLFKLVLCVILAGSACRTTPVSSYSGATVSPRDISDAVADSSLKPDSLFDNLVSRIDISGLNSVLYKEWHSAPSSCDVYYDMYEQPLQQNCARTQKFAGLTAESVSFQLAKNVTRAGFVTPKQDPGNNNEFIFEANMRIPVPLVKVNITLYNDTSSADQDERTLEVFAVSSKDLVLTVKFILNIQWRKIFVTEITTKESSVFRPSFACQSPSGLPMREHSYTLCKELSEILSARIFTDIEPSMREILRFKIEQLEPHLD